MIAQEELTFVTASTWETYPSYFISEILEYEEAASAAHNTVTEIYLDKFCALVVHPTTG